MKPVAGEQATLSFDDIDMTAFPLLTFEVHPRLPYIMNAPFRMRTTLIRIIMYYANYLGMRPTLAIQETTRSPLDIHRIHRKKLFGTFVVTQRINGVHVFL